MKELIKRAKKWRNDQWPEHQPNSGRPKSYLMAVLVISACCDYKEQLGCESYRDMVKRVNMDTLAIKYVYMPMQKHVALSAFTVYVISVVTEL